MIYLDYNATSPVHPDVRRAVRPFLEEIFGNPSSLHACGREARGAVEGARAELLSALGDVKGRLYFTSGGTEADNLAIRGVLEALKGGGKDHLVVSSVEHHAVLHTAQALLKEGFRVTFVPVDRDGRIHLDALEEAIGPATALLSVMHANNETGTVQPIDEIGRIAHARGVLFHTDAVQSFGKVPLDVRGAGVDLASLSSHKLGGLKGTGALYVRPGVPLRPLLHGGPQEGNFRGGTEGVLGIVGMGAAVAAARRDEETQGLAAVRKLRDQLEEGLRKRVPEVRLNGHPASRLPGTLNLSFLGCHGEILMMNLDLAGICVSTGSACSSGSTEPSHVLVAMGLTPAQVGGSIRFSLGWGTTGEEIDRCLEIIPPIVEQVRHARTEVSS